MYDSQTNSIGLFETMPLLTIHHKTEYRYDRPVAFGEHSIMLRPLPGHDLRILSHQLAIEPEPMRLRWIRPSPSILAIRARRP